MPKYTIRLETSNVKIKGSAEAGNAADVIAALKDVKIAEAAVRKPRKTKKGAE